MTTLSSAYDVLGLPETASPDDLRKAYRRLALRYHPDRNPGDEAAAEAFLAVRDAFERLYTPDPDAGFDAERVAAEVEQAAAEAERRRERRSRAPSADRLWQQVHVPLERPVADRIRRALLSRRALAGLGVAVVVALGATLGGLAPVWAGVAVGLALGGALVAYAAWTAEEEPWAVETHWQGLRDLRWDILVSWSEIRGLREGDGALDLALTEAAARRLRRLVPRAAFPEPAVYRLPLRDPSRLESILRAQLAE